MGQRVHEHAEPENIGELFEPHRLAFHLAPDRIGALAPSDDPRIDAAIGELFGELFFDLRDQQFAALGQCIQARGYDVVGFRIELAERQIVEFLAHLVHADATGKRRIDFEVSSAARRRASDGM